MQRFPRGVAREFRRHSSWPAASQPLFVRIWLDATPHRVQPRHRSRATGEGGSAWTTRRR
jgi:hypothetical protein